MVSGRKEEKERKKKEGRKKEGRKERRKSKAANRKTRTGVPSCSGGKRINRMTVRFRMTWFPHEPTDMEMQGDI